MTTKNLIRVQFKNGSYLLTPHIDFTVNGIRVWNPTICDDQIERLSEIDGKVVSRLRPDGNEIISIDFHQSEVSSFNAPTIDA